MSELRRDLNLALDPGGILRAYGLEPDPWQLTLLRARPPRALLNCCRQAGKSVTSAASALHEALYQAESLILMIAPSQRQSSELLRTTRSIYHALGLPTIASSDSNNALELANGSRILSLPATGDTIRGYAGVALIVIDEAARVPDDLYSALRPMLIISDGRLLALSTPAGQSGWFYEAWNTDADWHRVRITATDCPRIDPERLAEERRNMLPSFFASEYECEFSDAIDSVFAADDVRAALDPTLTPLFPGGW
jgi:hypothetical protein